MSAQNKPASKQQRRWQRHARKKAAAKDIPHLGVRVKPGLVRQHDYLKQQGLPHSSRVASLAPLLNVVHT